MVAAVCYLVDVLARFLVPGFGGRIPTFVAVILSTIAEVWMVLYLLVKGVRTPAEGTPARATPFAATAAAPSGARV
jgi:hypothetical protein